MQLLFPAWVVETESTCPETPGNAELKILLETSSPSSGSPPRSRVRFTPYAHDSTESWWRPTKVCHYNDVIMSAMASQITSLAILYSTVYSRRRSTETSKLRVTCLCQGNSPVTDECPAQKTSNAEKVSIWWRHHVKCVNSSHCTKS